MDQPYGVRDCAFRDPSGTILRLTAVPADPAPAATRLSSA